MKKSKKLILMLTVIALTACMLADALAENKIFTSPTFTIPKERVERDVPTQEPEETPQPEATPAAEQPDGWEPEGWEPESGEPEGETPDDKEKTDGPVERQVRIFSSRKDVVIENEKIILSSELIGFDGVDVHYQWQVDRGDGKGWVDVEGANGPTHTFIARRDTILFSWRLIISTDD